GGRGWGGGGRGGGGGAGGARGRTGSITASKSAGDASGRAASCTTTIEAEPAIASSPARTDAERVDPPGTAAATGRPSHATPAGSTRTTSSHARAAASTARSTRRLPATVSNCFGTPYRLPAPAATTMPEVLTQSGWHLRGPLLAEGVVGASLCGVLVDIEGEGQLGAEDLAGLGQHPLFARRQALVVLTDRQVPDHLGDLVDVAALELLDVVLEPAGPVRRHPRLLLAEHGEHLLDLLVVDHVAQPDVLGVVGRDHERQVPVREAKDQVVLLLAEDVLLLLLLDDGRSVVRVDDLVTNAKGHDAPEEAEEDERGSTRIPEPVSISRSRTSLGTPTDGGGAGPCRSDRCSTRPSCSPRCPRTCSPTCAIRRRRAPTNATSCCSAKATSPASCSSSRAAASPSRRRRPTAASPCWPCSRTAPCPPSPRCPPVSPAPPTPAPSPNRASSSSRTAPCATSSKPGRSSSGRSPASWPAGCAPPTRPSPTPCSSTSPAAPPNASSSSPAPTTSSSSPSPKKSSPAWSAPPANA